MSLKLVPAVRALQAQAVSWTSSPGVPQIFTFSTCIIYQNIMSAYFRLAFNATALARRNVHTSVFSAAFSTCRVPSNPNLQFPLASTHSFLSRSSVTTGTPLSVSFTAVPARRFATTQRRAKRMPKRAPELDDIVANENITAPELRVVQSDGSQLGVMSREAALQLAAERDEDLVIAAAGADPPVAKLVGLRAVKAKVQERYDAKRKAMKVNRVKGMRFMALIDDHDIAVKCARLRKFLAEGKHTEVTVLYTPGTAYSQQEPLRRRVLAKVVEELSDIAWANPATLRVLDPALYLRLSPEVKKGDQHLAILPLLERPLTTSESNADAAAAAKGNTVPEAGPGAPGGLSESSTSASLAEYLTRKSLQHKKDKRKRKGTGKSNTRAEFEKAMAGKMADKSELDTVP